MQDCWKAVVFFYQNRDNELLDRKPAASIAEMTTPVFKFNQDVDILLDEHAFPVEEARKCPFCPFQEKLRTAVLQSVGNVSGTL